MSDDKDDRGKKEPSAMEHMPLPYYVQLRIIDGEDQIPRVHDYHGWAYSVFEALIQACSEAGGKEVDGGKIRCETIAPDLAVYAEVFQSQMLASVAKALASSRNYGRVATRVSAKPRADNEGAS